LIAQAPVNCWAKKRLLYLKQLIAQAPGDLWARQGLDLALKMKFLPLLARGRLPEEAWLYPSFIGSVGVLLKPKTPSITVHYAVNIKYNKDSMIFKSHLLEPDFSWVFNNI
jgi:hypothetical protein